MPETPIITVILCTRNREGVISNALASLVRQDFREAWELIVVDNGSTDQTVNVVKDFSKILPIKVVHEPEAGKSRALNRGLDAARGDLIAFTDDDVILAPCWLSALVSASRSHPDATVFCGPILPAFPSNTPHWMPLSIVGHLAFARFTPHKYDGFLQYPNLPFGPNTAVRTKEATGTRFRLDLGPSSDGPFMCEDSDFVIRLYESGKRVFYVAAANVCHLVRPEMITRDYQFERAFHFGRSAVKMNRRLYCFSLGTYNVPYPERDAFEFGVKLNAMYGQLYQFIEGGDALLARIVLAAICGMAWDGRQSYLGRTTKDWLLNHPKYVPPIPARKRVWP